MVDTPNQSSDTSRTPPIDSSDRTLGLISPWQVLRKLWWELQLLKAIPDKIRVGVPTDDPLQFYDAWLYAAINAACTCVSLADWFFHSIKGDAELEQKTRLAIPNVSLRNETKFGGFLSDTNGSFRVCREVCNANKHFCLRSREDELKIMVSEFAYGGPDNEDYVGVGAHVTWNRDNSEATGNIEEILWSVANWWEELFSQVGLPDRLRYFPELKGSNPNYDV